MNWHALVRERLGDITGDSVRDAEIVEELAQHLASRLDELRGAGATDPGRLLNDADTSSSERVLLGTRGRPVAVGNALRRRGHRSPTLVAVVGVLGSVAALSIWLPARRAVQVDPLVALRHESTGFRSG